MKGGVHRREILVKEELIPTGGHYQSQSFAKAIPSGSAGDWTDFDDISFKFPINLVSAAAFAKAENDGDVVQFLIGPDTVIGALTADEAIGQDVLSVSQDVIDNTFVGARVKLSDGTNTDDCGCVLSVDDDANTIKVETATTHAFAAATPTYVKQTVEMAPSIELVEGEHLNEGADVLLSSRIPANTVIKVRYQNNDTVAKRFVVRLRYRY